MPARRGACLPTLVHQALHVVGIAGADAEGAMHRVCRNSAPCVTSMTRSPRSRSLRASSAPALGRPAAPSSANSSQALGSRRELAAPMPAMPVSCGPRARITECWALSASGQSATQTVSLKPASCSKLFHCSCERQGSSGRRSSSSNSHQPFSNPKIKRHEQPRARHLQQAASVPPEPSSCLT